MKVFGAMVMGAMVGLGATLQAQDAATHAFETCLRDLISENLENPFIDVFAIKLCGHEHVPYRHSCEFFEYWVPGRRANCEARDDAYWADQFAQWQSQDVEMGSMYHAGMDRCGKLPEAVQSACNSEVIYRTVLEFQSSPVRAEFFGSVGE